VDLQFKFSSDVSFGREFHPAECDCSLVPSPIAPIAETDSPDEPHLSLDLLNATLLIAWLGLLQFVLSF